MALRHLAAAVPLLGLVIACGGSDLGRVLHDYGYAELRPPSTLTPPGTIIARQSGWATPEILCPRDSALGMSVNVLSSDSKSSDLARKTEGSFEVSADFLSQIKGDARYKTVETVKLRLMNTKVLALPLSEALDKAKNRSTGCGQAIQLKTRGGASVSMVYSVLQADVVYTVEFDTSIKIDVSTKDNIMKGLAAELGGTYGSSGTTTITGTSLFWGLVDDADMLGSEPVPGVTIAKVVKDPTTGADLKVLSLLPDHPVSLVEANVVPTPAPAPTTTTPPSPAPPPPPEPSPAPPPPVVASCPMTCEGSGDGTRLRLDPQKTYRFVLRAKSVDPHQFHVLLDRQNANIMLVENSSIGNSFTVKDDSLKVCSKLRGTGGGCAWSCSVDTVAGITRFFTDQLSADFTVTCK
jgi:hypothetical protein